MVPAYGCQNVDVRRNGKAVETTVHDYEMSKDARHEVRRIVRGLLAENRAPGVSFAVFGNGGRVLFSEGYGISYGDATPGPDTVFRIASMSKSFTAATILSLVAEGQVRLDDSVERYATSFNPVTSWGNDAMPVTVGMLMSMSSGLATDDPWADRQESVPQEDLHRLMAQGLRYVFRPGEGFEYSNAGFAILGDVISSVTGRTVPAVVRERFLEPLGLTRTGYDYRLVGHDRAVGHSLHGGRWVEEAFTAPGSFSCIGGVLSTVEDISRWAGWLSSAFADDASASDGPLPRRYRRLMQQGHTSIPPVVRSGGSRGLLTVRETSQYASYGYGLFVEHDPRWGDIVYHPGGYPGFGSVMRWHPADGLGVVVLANGRYAPASVIGQRVLDVVLSDAGSVAHVIRPWAETDDAMAAVDGMLSSVAERYDGHDREGLIRACREGIGRLEPLLSVNVLMDSAADERATTLAGEIERIGGLVADGSGKVVPTDVVAETSAHRTWRISGRSGVLQCTIRMDSLARPGVETLEFGHVHGVAPTDVRESHMRTRLA